MNVNYLFMINKAFVDNGFDKLFVHKAMLTGEFANFGDWLRSKIRENDISNAELARRVDVSPTYIGNLLRNYSPNSKTGSIRASEKIVESIAKALNAPIDEARTAAGYAAKNQTVPVPKPIIEALAREGTLHPDDEILIADMIVRFKQGNKNE